MIEVEVSKLVKMSEKSMMDAMRFDKGNESAGKRTRKRMQAIRIQAKKVRVLIQAERKYRHHQKRMRVKK